jgi:tetratricopeptide (TPR) repeat protein
MVQLGQLYEEMGDVKKAEKTFNETIKQLSKSNSSEVVEVAKEFIKFKQYDYALKTYEKGKKIANGNYPYNLEMAELYGLMGDTEKMMNEYVSILEQHESYLSTIQNILQTLLVNDESGSKAEILKNILLEKIQKNQSKKIYSELLIWLYVQEKSFRAAFMQAKAMDKRFNENGNRMYALGKLALANNQYDEALLFFDYIINEKGTNNYYYINAKIEKVKALKEKVTQSATYTANDLTELENTYQTTLLELGKSVATLPLILDYIELKAYYLNKVNEAVNLTEEAMNLPGLSKQDKARLKILLADLYVLQNDIWNASLLYQQVEKDFKYDQLGEEAKFKNAKVFYYAGDFGWAQAQLNVLKGSTSKLIANDALFLSLLITENVGVDSNTVPLTLFAKAELYALQHQYDSAEFWLNKIETEYPVHSIMDDVWYKRYEMYAQQQQWLKADSALTELVERYPYGLLSDKALFKLAELNETILNNKERAKELYKQLLFTYKDSLFAEEARKRYRKLRGDSNK